MNKILILTFVMILVVGIPLIKNITGRDGYKSVDVGEAENRAIISSIIASGNLTHADKVLLSSEVIGKVKAVFVKEGDAVKKNELLLQLDDTEYYAAKKQSSAMVEIQKITLRKLILEYENIKLQTERKQVLFEKGLIDNQEYELSLLDLAVAELQIKSSEKSLVQAEAQFDRAINNLTKTRVYSPLDGIVTSLNIKAGETAISGTMNFTASTLMTIADPDSLRAEVYVNEADISSVNIGQRANVVAVARPNEAIVGVVESIAETAKVAAGRNGLSFLVGIRFKNIFGKKMWPGISVRAEIFTEIDAPKMAVPIRAITYLQESGTGKLSRSAYVFVLRNDRAYRIPVDAGGADDEYQAIIGNIQIGDTIILGPDRVLRSLEDGDRVTVDERKI